MGKDVGDIYYDYIHEYEARYPRKTIYNARNAKMEAKRDYDAYLMAKLPEVDVAMARAIQDEWAERLKQVRRIRRG